MTGRRISNRRSQARALCNLRGLPAYERVVEAARVIEEARQFQARLGALRLEAVVELRREGLTWREVGELVGVVAESARRLGLGAKASRL